MREARLPLWPTGATPLSDHVTGARRPGRPPGLVGVVVERGRRRQAGRAACRPGARLVSKAGDLWRWDGFIVRAAAPQPAAMRLEQKTRLARP